jgi:alpha-tubulin suppressor-like RCC1 family protein
MSQTKSQLVSPVGILTVSGINVSGVVTATSFSGDGSGLTGVGVGTEDNINTTGIITASAVSANEFIGTGDRLIFSPTITSFSPTDGATGVNALSSPNIVLTYNQPIGLGTTGTITLRTVSAGGTIVESFSVGVSTRATVSNQTLTIDPTSNLDYNQEYYVVIPQGGITNFVGGNSALLNTYNFTTEAGPVLSSVSPGIGSTNVSLSTNIVFTFDKNIRPGIGTITLRTVSATGTIIESYDVASSGELTFSTNTLTIDPTSNLSADTTHFVVVPNNAVAGYTGINTYSFTTANITNPLFSWGRNLYGNLGQNNRTYASSPVQIPGTSWSSISAASNYSLATKTDNTLWSWGAGINGQSGQNTTTNVSSPVQIPGTTWSSISAGYYHSLAKKTDNTLWAWGSGSNGALGQNNRTSFSSPVQIPGTTWSSISGGGQHSLATKTDNTLWVWGWNIYGQLGQNNRTYFSSPVQIPGTTWSSISGRGQHSLATKTDNTLWSWGLNQFGQLGQNNRTYFSSPIQIPGTSWSSISSGGLYSLATKTDNTLWAWGYNLYGQLGQNNRTSFSSPVQIPGTSWSSISGGGQHSLATQAV